jgi:DNA-binding NtrC family response regulator
MTTEGTRHGDAARPACPGHILLFEDDDTLASLLARVLRTEGYEVDVFDSADAVPAPAQLARYDVVLSDIHLANETNGHDVLRIVRESSAATPVILMTAYADIDGAMNAVGQGAYDYLGKPIEPNELKRMVTEAIGRRKLAQTAEKPPDRWEGHASAQIVGTTASMLSVYKTVAHVAPNYGHGTHRRRERDRKGAGGEGHSRQEPSRVQTIRGDQLRRASRVHSRE